VKLCRFDDDRLGLVDGDDVLDVSAALDAIPAQRWPIAQGDPLIIHLERVALRARALAASAPRRKLGTVKLKSPVANPTKIVNAPINYQAHIDEARNDQAIAHGRDLSTQYADLG
jgi:2,4-didehydro-3-deoxy-L-rhamnonate hydrolase